MQEQLHNDYNSEFHFSPNFGGFYEQSVKYTEVANYVHFLDVQRLNSFQLHRVCPFTPDR